MGKWKNLLKKQHAQTQLKNDDFVTVQVNPDAYQVILTIAKDGKTADLTQLEKGGQIPMNLLLNGLLLVYNQALGELAIKSYLQKQAGLQTDAGKEA
jgi:hypothetical protein